MMGREPGAVQFLELMQEKKSWDCPSSETKESKAFPQAKTRWLAEPSGLRWGLCNPS